MVLGFAPIAFLTPISRVRSVTETSMIFIRPTAAPNSVTIPIIVAASVTELMVLSNRLTILSLFDTLKSDSSRGSRFLTILNTASASPVIISRFTGFTGIIVMLKFMLGREKYCLAVVTGIKQTLSP